MQKKQMIQFAVLLVLILALAGTYAGIRSYNTRQEEEEAQREADAEVPLTSFEPDSVTAICYDCNGAEYNFEKDGEEWKETSNREITIDQDAFEQFLQKAGAITVNTQVQAQDGEDYGFSNPTRTVTITTINGTSSLTFGMKNEMLSQYYVKTSESSKIYLADESVYTTFEKTAEDFEKAETDTDIDADQNADIDQEQEEE